MNINRYVINSLLLALLSITGQALAQGELEILIDSGVEDPLAVAIVPFGWSGLPGAQPVDLHVTVANDLARSGRFSAMDEMEMPQKPTDYGQVNFKDWQLLQMENVVIGNLKQTAAGDYEIEFRLLDVYKESQLAGFRIAATQKQLRRTAHRVSDIIFEKLIGLRGAFNTRIAYVTVKKNAEGRKRYTLQIADADGFSPQVLLESTQPLLSPAWSPDGRYLAYVSFEGWGSSVFLQDILTGQRDKVASHEGINSAPSFSPDGQRLALTLSKEGNPEIFILRRSDNSLQRVTRNRAIDTEPDWSPDGKKLIFTSDRGGSPQVYEVDVPDGKPKRLTFDGPYFARPQYSPDGSGIAMVHGNNGIYRIAYLDLESQYLSILTDGRLDESPSFSPNGGMIIYAATGRHGSELAAVSADGSVHQRLALQDGEVREPAWGPFPAR